MKTKLITLLFLSTIAFVSCNKDDIDEELNLQSESKMFPVVEQAPPVIELSLNFGKTNYITGTDYASFFIKSKKALSKDLRIEIDYSINNSTVIPVRPEFHIKAGERRSEGIYNVHAGAFGSVCDGGKNVTLKATKVYYGGQLLSQSSYSVLPSSGQTSLFLRLTNCNLLQMPDIALDFDFDGVTNDNDECPDDYGTEEDGCPPSNN
ncbi:hypothetical protein [Aquimarina sp. 2201CG14-23]|uniref:hypothetical protein n=1 Tax=Aquimarina mycalae TaxID=3040073 RepID=UPI002477E3FE|nr:hypothetical protein [Aquimarina sp. 2201CG14-23]MDH7445038.1 hypothetical protein [Aquimarina sp. 2201CG14-23]